MNAMIEVNKEELNILIEHTENKLSESLDKLNEFKEDVLRMEKSLLSSTSSEDVKNDISRDLARYNEKISIEKELALDLAIRRNDLIRIKNAKGKSMQKYYSA